MNDEDGYRANESNWLANKVLKELLLQKCALKQVQYKRARKEDRSAQFGYQFFPKHFIR